MNSIKHKIKQRLHYYVAGTGLLMAAAMLSTPATASDTNADLNGLWRGKIEVQPGVALVVGVTIEGDTVTLDSPNQGLWNHTLSSASITDGTLSFSANDLQAQFEGKIDGDQIAGTFTQGRARALTLTRLSADDMARLPFEAGYAGNLVINGQQKLPLQVNAAVIANGYYATLDSPAQQSYGIPLTNFSINAEQMQFESPMIKATYQGSANSDGDYEGTFVQGVERPLVLKKRSKDASAAQEQADVPKPKTGDYGGAIAVITPAGATHKFFAEHNQQTRYEIGSVTKTMVAYLLAKGITDRAVTQDQSLQTLIDTAPAAITLNQLATHTSKLPRLPADLFDEADATDPYAHYSYANVLAALAKVEIAEPSSATASTNSADDYEYSNFGYGALAEALAQANSSTFAELMSTQLFQPLGMENSSVALVGQTDEQLAQGYDVLGNPMPPWHFQALAGAGAVRSSLPDMIKYVQAMMVLSAEQAPLAKVLFAPQFTLGNCCQQALGWILQQDDNGQWFAWHNGQTAGFGSYVGFYLDGSRAVVLLNNQTYVDNGYAEQLLQGTVALHE